MQSIIYAIISKADLKLLFGIGEDVLNRWISAGLPGEPDGRFVLSEICRWVREYYQQIERQKVTLSDVTQRDLIALTGQSRQTIFNWTRAGMPRNKDKSYSLAAVMRWLPGYYDQVYKQKHQRIAKQMAATIREIRLKKISLKNVNHIELIGDQKNERRN